MELTARENMIVGWMVGWACQARDADIDPRSMPLPEIVEILKESLEEEFAAMAKADE